MKTIRRLRAALCLAPSLAIALITPAFGSTTVSYVNVPFAFSTGKQEMPAGRYRLERLSSPSIFLMTNVATGKRVQVVQPPGGDANPRALVFKGGNAHILSVVR